MEKIVFNCDSSILSSILRGAEELEYEPTADITLTYRELQAVTTVLGDVYNAFISMEQGGTQFSPHANNFMDDLEKAYHKLNEAY